MKTITLLSALCFATSLLVAQKTQLREIKSFKTLYVFGNATIIYTQSDKLLFKVVADEDEIDQIKTAQDSQILTINPKGRFKNDYTIYINANTLEKVLITGVVKFTTSNAIKADSLVFDANDASKIKAIVNTQKLNVLSSGASEVKIEGVTNNFSIDANDASEVDAYKLKANTVIVSASGVTDVKVYASDKLTANAEDASSIKIKGNPKELSVEASSGSVITKVEEEMTSSKNDSTTFNFGKRKLILIDKEATNSISSTNTDDYFKNWRGFGIGFNFLSSELGEFNLNKGTENMRLNNVKSTSVFLNLAQKNFHIYKNYINLATGIGVQWNSYSFNKRVTLKADSSFTYARIDSASTINYKENKLRNTYLNIPLLLEFNSNIHHSSKSLHVLLGVIGGIKLGSRSTQAYNLNSDNVKIVRKDDFNQNLFRLNAHASIGTNNISLFVDYALTPLFESNRGPQIYPFSVGIKFISF